VRASWKGGGGALDETHALASRAAKGFMSDRANIFASTTYFRVTVARLFPASWNIKTTARHGRKGTEEKVSALPLFTACILFAH